MWSRSPASPRESPFGRLPTGTRRHGAWDRVEESSVAICRGATRSSVPSRDAATAIGAVRGAARTTTGRRRRRCRVDTRAARPGSADRRCDEGVRSKAAWTSVGRWSPCHTEEKSAQSTCSSPGPLPSCAVVLNLDRHQSRTMLGRAVESGRVERLDPTWSPACPTACRALCVSPGSRTSRRRSPSCARQYRFP